MRVYIYFLWIALSASAYAEPVLDALRDQRAMNAALPEQDLSAFLQWLNRNKVAAPIIRSQWFVEANAGQAAEFRELEGLRRSFGRKLGESLEQQAQTIATGGRDDVYGKVESLFRLAKWLTTNSGYGNFLLGARCLDIAAVGLAQLILDLKFPASKIEPLIPLLTPAWLGAPVRAAIINDEARQVVIVHQDLYGPDGEQVLASAWASGVKSVHDWMRSRTPERRIARGSDRPRLRKALPIELRVFLDDDSQSLEDPKTLLRGWDSKQHSLIALGPNLQNCKQLMGFFLFRSKVGSFPTKYEKPVGPFRDEVEAAFERAWRPFGRGADERVRLAYAPAYQVFDQLRRGEFVDYDTFLTRRALLSQ